MFPDINEPTEILQDANLNARICPIDFPTQIMVMCHYRKQNQYASMDG